MWNNEPRANVGALQDEIIQLAASCQYSPSKWAKAAWDWGNGELSGYDGARRWQEDAFRELDAKLQNPATRYQPILMSVASGHGIGKSAFMGMLANWGMSCWNDAKLLCTANTESQLRTKTAPEIGKWFRLSLTADWFDVQATSIKSLDPKHSEAWRMDFIPWSENNTEAFAGLHNKGKLIIVMFDEASKISDKIWEVVEGALTDEDTVIIWVAFGNPTRNTGRFRECFRRYKHRWINKQIDSRTVEGTNKSLFSKWADDYGEDSDFFKIRVRGIFPSMSTKQFISEADVDMAFGKHLRKEEYEFAPVIIGVDPAWEGDDELVICKRQGLVSEILRVIGKNDNDVHIANLIANLEDEHKADAVFVDAGYGTGIVSAGKTMGRDWQLVWFSGETIDKGYMNKRAEMWGLMKQWLKSGASIPNDNVLRDDLISVETVARLDGKILLESKRDMKERGVPSPNRADALALTFAFPVNRKTRGAGISRMKVNEEYDPYSV